MRMGRSRNRKKIKRMNQTSRLVFDTGWDAFLNFVNFHRNTTYITRKNVIIANIQKFHKKKGAR